ncbi:MAG: N-formylglutamate amidohydrolase [Pseudomonadota bacterium]
MFALLEDDEPAPLMVCREDGASPFFLSGDHAGNAVPRALSSLGLPQAELDRHIGIDIGVALLGRMLSDRLDATFVWQPYSRLVIDCNRFKGQPDSIPERSDGTVVPGNLALSDVDRAARHGAIFDPYHQGFGAALDRRAHAGRPSVLVALHSFTPHHGDYPQARPWEISVLYNRDARLARPLIRHLRGEDGLTVGENEPYVVSDELDYGIPVHGEARGILSVELEIRQDTLGDAAACRLWAERLARVLPASLQEVAETETTKTRKAGA